MSESDEPNEILATTRDVKSIESVAEKAGAEARARRWPIGRIAAGVGIGSAAVAAALLFANRHPAKRPRD